MKKLLFLLILVNISAIFANNIYNYSVNKYDFANKSWYESKYILDSIMDSQIYGPGVEGILTKTYINSITGSISKININSLKKLEYCDKKNINILENDINKIKDKNFIEELKKMGSSFGLATSGAIVVGVVTEISTGGLITIAAVGGLAIYAVNEVWDMVTQTKKVYDDTYNINYDLANKMEKEGEILNKKCEEYDFSGYGCDLNLNYSEIIEKRDTFLEDVNALFNNFNFTKNYIEGHLDGYNEYMESINEKIKEIIDNEIFIKEEMRKKEKEYSTLKEWNKNKIKEIEKEINNLEKENIQYITESEEINKENLGDVSRVDEDLKDIKREIKRINEMEEENEFNYSIKNKNYLKNSINNENIIKENLEMIKEDIISLDDEIDDVLNNIKERVDTKKEEVKNKNYDENYYNEAEKFYEKAIYEEKRGDKYKYYLNAYIYYEKAEENKGDEYIEESMEKIFKRAEKDGINVDLQRRLWASYSDKEKIERYEEIKNEIVDEAKIIYGDLKEKRKKVWNYLDICDNCENEKTKVETMEKGIVIGGIINYYNGLGKLKEMEDVYGKVLDNLKKNIKEMEKEIIVSNKIDYGFGEIDNYTTITSTINLFNPTNILFKNITKKVKSKEAFSYGDLVDKKDINSIYYGNSYLYITLKEIKPKETKTIQLTKKEVVCYSSGKEEENIGIDKDIYNYINKTFYCEKQLESIYIPGDYNEVYLDNKRIGSGIDIIKITKSNHKLKYYLLEERIIEYKEEEGGREINEIEYYNKNITINSPKDLDYYKTSIYIPDEAKNLQIYAIDGETVEYKNNEIKVKNIIKNKDIKIIIKYQIFNLSSWINKKINELEVMSLSEENKDKLEEIKNNNYTNEEKYNKIIEIINSENKEKRKVNEIKKEIEEELEKIGDIKGNSTFAKLLEKRKNKLYKLKEEGDINKLEEYDKNWLKKAIANEKKELYRKVNEIKKKIYKCKTNISTSDIDELKINISYAEKGEKLVNIEEKINEINKEIICENKKEENKNYNLEIKKLEKIMKQYNSLYKNAEKTKYIEYFELTPSDNKQFLEKMKNKYNEEEYDKIYEKINKTIRKLEEIAYKRIKLLEKNENTDKNKLTVAKFYYKKEMYVKALKEMDQIEIKSKKIEKKEMVRNQTIIYLTILLFVLIILYLGYEYYLKNIKGKKDEKKEKKKLKKFSE